MTDWQGFWARLASVGIISDLLAEVGKARHVSVSHSEGSFRGGQGRAPRQRRFRPAFYAGFVFCSQGMTA